MGKHEEIEIKWNAFSTELKRPVERTAFNAAIKKYVRGKKYRKVVVAGFDYYYTSPEGDAPRHRHGAITNELTIKARLSKKSTTIRREINVKLAKETSPIEVQAFMTEIGFDKCLPIHKDCDIYFIEEFGVIVDVVWYRVTCGTHQVRDFLEVEVHESTKKKSMEVLGKWKSWLHREFGVTDKDIVNQSLYEIYSGKTYKMARRVK